MRGKNGTITVYEWPCRYCEDHFEGRTPGAVNTEGREHLLENHRSRLAKRYLGELAGKTCEGDCDYEFVADGDENQGFVCPECGYDNLRYYAGRLVWRSLRRM